MIRIETTQGFITVTENDWGRLYRFGGSGDVGLMMPYRSYYTRPLNAGSWTDLSIGLIYSVCGNVGGDTSIPVDERQSEIAVANLPHFGLTKKDLTVNEVSANPRFLGLRGIMGGVTQITASPLQLANLFLTYVNDDVVKINNTILQMPLTNDVVAGPFAFIGLRYLFNPLTKTLSINYSKNPTVNMVDATNVDVMTAALQGLSNNVITPTAQFTGIAAVSDFSSYYIYWPYNKNRMKLQCIAALRNG